MPFKTCPDYRENIAKAFLPRTGEMHIDYSINELRKSLQENTEAEIYDVGLSRIGNVYSLWVRDPAVFIGYDEDKPSVLMTDDITLYSAGSAKDVGDRAALKEQLEYRNIEVNEVPFFVIGGDCLITDRHAVLGWLTPQANGRADGDYQRGIDAIKRTFERYELECLILDDVGKLDENKYHERQNNGFFHIDTAAGFLENQKGAVNAIVSKPHDMQAVYQDDSIRYSDYVSETLDKYGYPVHMATAIVSPDSLWSPTNILVDGDKRIVFLSDSFDGYINREAEGLYSTLDHKTVIVEMDRALHAAKGGARCTGFLIKQTFI